MFESQREDTFVRVWAHFADHLLLWKLYNASSLSFASWGYTVRLVLFLTVNANMLNSSGYSRWIVATLWIISAWYRFSIVSVCFVFWRFPPWNETELEWNGDIRDQISQKYQNMWLPIEIWESNPVFNRTCSKVDKISNVTGDITSKIVRVEVNSKENTMYSSECSKYF
jgi:hypothetical protein